jgi:hypothetical protein
VSTSGTPHSHALVAARRKPGRGVSTKELPAARIHGEGSLSRNHRYKTGERTSEQPQEQHAHCDDHRSPSSLGGSPADCHQEDSPPPGTRGTYIRAPTTVVRPPTTTRHDDTHSPCRGTRIEGVNLSADHARRSGPLVMREGIETRPLGSGRSRLSAAVRPSPSAPPESKPVGKQALA